MEVNSNKENTQINPHIQSGSFNELTFNKKVVWIILNLLLLLCFLGVAYSGGKALLANTFLPYIVFLVIFDLPIIALFIIFMFLPSLIPNRVIVSILALVFFVIFYLVTPSIAPVTYLWPQVIVAILYYLTTFGLFILVIYPLGKLYSQIGLRFLIQYQSPKTISNLVYSGPSNLIYSFQGQILRIIAVIFLIFIIGISVHITVSQPSIWGIGVFDLPSSFPTMSSFQAQTESKFFNTPLGTNYSIQQYVRNPVSSMCWSQLPQDIANNYPLNRPVTQEFKIMDTTTNSEIGLATIKSSCSLNSDSLRQETQGNVSIYKYSDSYLNIEFPGVQDLLKYPSYATSASSISISSAGQILPVQRVIDQ